jgi:hypothetical protein
MGRQEGASPSEAARDLIERGLWPGLKPGGTCIIEDICTSASDFKDAKPY